MFTAGYTGGLFVHLHPEDQMNRFYHHLIITREKTELMLIHKEKVRDIFWKIAGKS